MRQLFVACAALAAAWSVAAPAAADTRVAVLHQSEAAIVLAYPPPQGWQTHGLSMDIFLFHNPPPELAGSYYQVGVSIDCDNGSRVTGIISLISHDEVYIQQYNASLADALRSVSWSELQSALHQKYCGTTLPVLIFPESVRMRDIGERYQNGERFSVR